MKRSLPRGAASLIVVLLLFLVLSLTAAYTSRSLIFEQKTSANQARSTAALEVAEAGIEWTLAQLNGGRIADDCVESAGLAEPNFQQRYLNITTPSGAITKTLRAGASPLATVWPACVYNGSGWNCACPANAPASPAAATTLGNFPAFRVWPAVFEPQTTDIDAWTTTPPPWYDDLPRVFQLLVNGCTRLPNVAGDRCLDFMPRAEIGDAATVVRVMVGMRSALATSPAAAVTARLGVVPFNPSPSVGPKLAVINTDLRSNGYTVNSGEALTTALFEAQSVPGTPGEFSFAGGDPRLANLLPAPTGASPLTSGERMFVLTFGMKRQTYREQPGLRVCESPCDATSINTLLANYPNRVIWVEGDLTLNASIGDPTPGAIAPVLLIVNGDTLTLGAGVEIYGFVYMTGGASATSTIQLPDDPTSIRGALVAEGGLTTTYSGTTPASSSMLTVTYDAEALALMRTSYGSWVRLGGSWRDFGSWQ